MSRCWALALRCGKFVVELLWARPLVVSVADVRVVEVGPKCTQVFALASVCSGTAYIWCSSRDLDLCWQFLSWQTFRHSRSRRSGVDLLLSSAAKLSLISQQLQQPSADGEPDGWSESGSWPPERQSFREVETVAHRQKKSHEIIIITKYPLGPAGPLLHATPCSESWCSPILKI